MGTFTTTAILITLIKDFQTVSISILEKLLFNWSCPGTMTKISSVFKSIDYETRLKQEREMVGCIILKVSHESNLEYEDYPLENPVILLTF